MKNVTYIILFYVYGTCLKNRSFLLARLFFMADTVYAFSQNTLLTYILILGNWKMMVLIRRQAAPQVFNKK